MSIFSHIVSSFSAPSTPINYSGDSKIHILDDSYETTKTLGNTFSIYSITESNTKGVQRISHKDARWIATGMENKKRRILYKGPSLEEAIKARKQWEQNNIATIKKGFFSTEIKKELGVYVDLSEPITARDGKLYYSCLPTGIRNVYCEIGAKGLLYFSKGYQSDTKKKVSLYRGDSFKEAVLARRKWEKENDNL